MKVQQKSRCECVRGAQRCTSEGRQESVNSLEMATRGTALREADRRSGSEVKKQRAEEAFGPWRDAGIGQDRERGWREGATGC